MMASGWDFDYVMNLSESDFPMRPVEMFEEYLKNYNGFNFLAMSWSDGFLEFHDFQGMKKTFHNCDNHMFAVGERKVFRN